MFPQATSRRRQGFLDAMNGGNATATGGFGGQGSAAAYPQSFAPQADPSQVRDPNGNQVFSGPLAGPSQTSGPITPVAGRPFLLGFETSKLLDPNKGPGDSGKYSAAAKAFGQAYLGGTDIGRGNLEPMLNAVKAQFPNARIVGDDKIDFGDGYGPVDVVRSDGTVVFQNTTGNPNYERAYAAGQIGHGATGVPRPLSQGGYDYSGINPGGTSRPPAQAAGPAPTSTSSDPYAAMGGGTFFSNTGQWVPNNNPQALAAAAAANGGPGQAGGAPAAATAAKKSFFDADQVSGSTVISCSPNVSDGPRSSASLTNRVSLSGR